jgi:activator of 2-hydroxyglutaryl-CoA dehydratase
MEVFADLLNVPINEIGQMSLDVPEEPPPVSSTCVVFAKSEASGLLRQGWPKNKVIASYCLAMASRVVTLLERIGITNDFAITGGIAKNVGIVKRISEKLGVKPLDTSVDTQIAGALGAALFGKALVEKGKG